MSDNPGATHAQPKNPSGSPIKPGSLPRRWPLYLGLLVIAVLLVAYIDGGQEPIRPIIEPVAMPTTEDAR
jgi:hypothetical protein